ncbi:unnamed protein product [Rotaria sp. Silwood2]|nr:unnamed protein product [Rotaria sp. Silwood2]CAF4484637.1 unnamed protein product [Rotaria sp. Silwood2]
MSTEPHLAADFRSTSPSSFQALSTLCGLIKTTITDNLSQFYSNHYVSVYVTPSALFQLQTQSLIEKFMGSTTRSFLLSLSMIRGSIHGDALSSGLQTNYRQVVQNNNVFSIAQNYGNCSCASSATCILQSAIYDYFSTVTLFNIPGFYTGCYVIESLLQSDLRCFYNQTCINQLQTYLSSSPPMNVKALDSSLPSVYFENSPISECLASLMVEQWNITLSYDMYYSQCQPMECTYTVETRNDTTHIAAMLIGVIGGSIAILNIIARLLVKVIQYCSQKPRTPVSPVMPPIHT